MKKKKPPANAKIDKALNSLMDRLTTKDADGGVPPDVAVKIINSAVAWEKVKHQIREGGDGGFDPDHFDDADDEDLM
jgi:hypothetical protein